MKNQLTNIIDAMQSDIQAANDKVETMHKAATILNCVNDAEHSFLVTCDGANVTFRPITKMEAGQALAMLTAVTESVIMGTEDIQTRRQLLARIHNSLTAMEDELAKLQQQNPEAEVVEVIDVAEEVAQP